MNEQDRPVVMYAFAVVVFVVLFVAGSWFVPMLWAQIMGWWTGKGAAFYWP